MIPFERSLYALWMLIEPPSGISHEGYITIMITLLGIIIAVGGFVAALLGFVGYRTLADEVIRRAEAAAKEVSLNRTTERAVEAARTEAASVAERIISENKDKWLTDLNLGIQLAAAQSEVPPVASNQVEAEREAVSAPYPDQAEEEQNATSTGTDDVPEADAGADNPPPPKQPPGEPNGNSS